jgi:hypothetical protein
MWYLSPSAPPPPPQVAKLASIDTSGVTSYNYHYKDDKS